MSTEVAGRRDVFKNHHGRAFVVGLVHSRTKHRCGPDDSEHSSVRIGGSRSQLVLRQYRVRVLESPILCAKYGTQPVLSLGHQTDIPIAASPSDTSPNQYSINLLNALFNKSGGRPVLRVGGTTGQVDVIRTETPVLLSTCYSDGYTYDCTLTQPIYPAPASTQTGSPRIGPNFWKLTQLLSDADPLWLPQLSYTNTNGTQTVEAAQSMVSAIGKDNIIAMEISNEPNEYGGHTGPSAKNAT